MRFFLKNGKVTLKTVSTCCLQTTSKYTTSVQCIPLSDGQGSAHLHTHLWKGLQYTYTLHKNYIVCISSWLFVTLKHSLSLFCLGSRLNISGVLSMAGIVMLSITPPPGKAGIPYQCWLRYQTCFSSLPAPWHLVGKAETAQHLGPTTYHLNLDGVSYSWLLSDSILIDAIISEVKNKFLSLSTCWLTSRPSRLLPLNYCLKHSS